MNAVTDFRSKVAAAHQNQDFTDVVASIPYAQLLSLEFQRFGRDVMFKLPAKEEQLGNPLLPAIHGGAIGGFMELSGSLHLLMLLGLPTLPKIVDFSIDYLRAARLQDTFAECELVRQGSRVANLYIRTWQTRRAEAIATARAHFLIVD